MMLLAVGLLIIGVHYWQHRGADWSLVLAGAMLAIGLTEVPMIGEGFIAALRLAYNGFADLGIVAFMLIVGTITVVMLWVFSKW